MDNANIYKSSEDILNIHSQQEPVKGHYGYPLTQVPLENSVESHWKFSEIPLKTSENLLETS